MHGTRKKFRACDEGLSTEVKFGGNNRSMGRNVNREILGEGEKKKTKKKRGQKEKEKKKILVGW